MKNNFPSANPLESATDAFEITPGPGDLPQVPRALWVGTGGDVTVELTSGEVTFTNVPGGTLLLVRPSKVLGATTASGILGLV